MRAPELTGPEQQRIFRLLHSQLQEYDRLLVGWDAICRFLWDAGISTGAKTPVKYMRVYRWAKRHGFPLLPGRKGAIAITTTVTSQHAVIAWILSRQANGVPMRAFIHLPR